MAPLSRLRSGAGGMPTALAAEYYGQRASEGGLIVSEGSYMAEGSNGYLGVPGINAEQQIAGWKRITDAVHAKGGHIFLQLWHVGRVSHAEHQPGGEAPVAPSAVPFEGVVFTSEAWVASTPARALPSPRAQSASITVDRGGRLREKAPLTAYQRNTFYGGDEAGYTDYPFLASVAKAA